jgi:hypothetical protein
MAGACEHEAELRPCPPHLRKCLEQPRVVLVRPPVRGIEQERRPATFLSRRGEPLEIDRQMDRAHALRRESEPLDQRLAGVLGDRDHDPAAPDRPAIDNAPICELRPREELRQELVLDVEHGRGGRRAVDRRQHHGEREVNRFEAIESKLSAHGPWDRRGERHRRDASRHRASRAV